MNETLKEFTKELAADLQKRLEDPSTARFIEKLEKADKSGLVRFEVVMSTADEDRQGDALDQKGWNFEYFDLNPVVLFAHDYGSMPVAMVTSHKTVGERTICEGYFAPAEIYPWAGVCAGMYEAGFLKAVSPGYILNEDGTRELLEMSFCAVPAGRLALSTQQMRALKTTTRELISKGFSFMDPVEKKETKTPQLGDRCERTDGSPGVLAEDGKNPGTLICVPEAGGKNQNNNNNKNMKDEMQEKLKEEHGRHGNAVAKAIDEFTTKAMECKGEKKAEGDKPDNDEEYAKAIDVFTKAVTDENLAHREACMKAIDDTWSLEDQHDGKSFEQKDIDEFKTAMDAEHVKHIDAFTKSIDEFKSASESKVANHEKAIDEFTTKSATELERHEKAHMDMSAAAFDEKDGDDEAKKVALAKKGAVGDELAETELRQEKYKKLDRAWNVFYAFTSAFMDDGVAVEDYDKLLDEAVVLMKATEDEQKKMTGSTIAPLIGKAGRTISAKTKAKVEAVIKAMEDHHKGQTEEHQKSTDTVIAALKDLMGPESSEGGDTEEKISRTPKPRSSTTHTETNNSVALKEFETLLFAQRLVRQIGSTTQEGLRQINEAIAKRYPAKRK